MYKFKFTIYTPVFNSGIFFERVFNSVKKQTFNDFEWIIINDGSTDNSAEIIKKLLSDYHATYSFLDIKDNIGFNKSMNLAVNKAQGEFFLIAHADDEFTDNCLDTFIENYNCLTENQKKIIQGIKCNCLDQNGNFIGDPFPTSPFISDIFELHYIKKIKGEKWGFVKTDIMKEFPFPEDDKFIPETVIWHRMFSKYPAVFINFNLRIYYTDQTIDSLTKRTKNDDRYAKGKRILPLDFINNYSKMINHDPKSMLTFYIAYWRYSLQSKIKLQQMLKDIKKPLPKIIFLALLPVGYVFFRIRSV